MGRPNVGKSTFLNTVIGSKISITTSKPQTTRDRILGIFDTSDAQIIFLDTPGIHQAGKALNKYMVEKALSTLSDADIAMVMTAPDETVELLSEVTAYVRTSGKEAVLVLNKADLLSQEDREKRLGALAGAGDFRSRYAVSSLTGEGIGELMNGLKNLLPEGPRFFPEDMITDAPLRFLCQELIREKVFTLTQKEIPYAAAVEVEEFREGEPTYIRAAVHVERPSQKGIVIGAGGKMLKEIGKQARMDIQRLLGTRVFLELFVKVTKDWTRKPSRLKDLGYK
ncbi:MAG: GTPase Era [Deltaproteobacteria bacterium ADurb.BinA179]|jgi:GTP-binding protein Era|nr:MAG: GTPase Era [Deltaproteobacteria bacterium ADurb.BinA179]